MSKDHELDRLKSEKQSLFQDKQAARARWHDAKERADAAYDASQEAWNARVSAKETLSYEYNQLVQSSDNYRDVWDEYSRIRDYNNSRIEALRSEADYEHQQMQECFSQASYAYEYGDKASAPYYSQQGHEHKNRRNGLNTEISALANEVKEARQNAEWRAPKTDSSAFHNAKAEFDREKAEHQRRESEFKRLKAERDRLKAEFDSLNSQYYQAKEAYQRRLDQIKDRKNEKIRKIESALIPATGRFDGKAAKIVERNDGSGKTDIYFGGINPEGDGLGHGHAVIEDSGQITYLRGQYQDHNDWQINDMADLADKDGRVRFKGDHTKI